MHAWVVGEHGDSAVLLFSSATIAGLTLDQFARQTGVDLVGGTLDAGALDGGFAVTARLPLEPVAAPVPAAAPTSSRALAAARRRLWRGLMVPVVAPGARIAILILLYVANFDWA